jgi:hypothetical protein
VKIFRESFKVVLLTNLKSIILLFSLVLLHLPIIFCTCLSFLIYRPRHKKWFKTFPFAINSACFQTNNTKDTKKFLAKSWIISSWKQKKWQLFIVSFRLLSYLHPRSLLHTQPHNELTQHPYGSSLSLFPT